MGDVEHELVFGCAERAVEGDSQFDDAEVGADMTAIFRGHGDELGADFLSELRELGRGEGFDVFRAVDRVQQASVEGGRVRSSLLSLLGWSRIFRRRSCRLFVS